jgi:hypothetical protein
MRSFSRLLLVSIASISIAKAAVSQDGSIVTVNGIQYYAPPNVTTTIKASKEQLGSACGGGPTLIPITVMEGVTTADSLQALVKNYTAVDDVFNAGFLQGMTSNLDLLDA